MRTIWSLRQQREIWALQQENGFVRAERDELEAELVDLRESVEGLHDHHADDQAEIARLREGRDTLQAAMKAHKCIIHFKAEDGDSAMKPNDGSDLAAAIVKVEGKE